LKKLLHAGRSGNVYHVDKMDENRWQVAEESMGSRNKWGKIRRLGRYCKGL
jgi:hypothetical protein